MIPVSEMPVCALLDGKMREKLRQVIAERGITTVVETGIDRGGSTMLFTDMVPYVVGVDNDIEKINIVKRALDERGISTQRATLMHMDSPTALRLLVASGDIDAEHTLFLLDAHWQAYWPLRDEVRAIPRGQGVLVMHDARVPGCPSLGVDSYEGQELSYEYLKDVLTEWSPEHVVEYNDATAEWPHRGVMYIYPRAL